MYKYLSLNQLGLISTNSSSNDREPIHNGLCKCDVLWKQTLKMEKKKKVTSMAFVFFGGRGGTNKSDFDFKTPSDTVIRTFSAEY